MGLISKTTAPRPRTFGQLEPVTDWASPFTVQGIFGRSAPNPLVMTNHPSNLLEGADVAPVMPLSGVQTVDAPGGSPDLHVSHWSNLLSPMHSEAFWVLLIALAVLGIFSGQVRLGPVHAGIGK